MVVRFQTLDRVVAGRLVRRQPLDDDVAGAEHRWYQLNAQLGSTKCTSGIPEPFCSDTSNEGKHAHQEPNDYEFGQRVQLWIRAASATMDHKKRMYIYIDIYICIYGNTKTYNR